VKPRARPSRGCGQVMVAMITDWLRNPDTLRLSPLVAALVCALVLAATRRRLPPESPRWRLARALFIVACMIGGYAVVVSLLGWRAGMLITPALGGFDRGLIGTLSAALGIGVFMGWLIPTVIEGRSLRQMGWHSVRLGRYVLFGVIAGLALAVLRFIGGLPRIGLEELLPEIGSPWAVLSAKPGLILWAGVLGFGGAAWVEENIFRGHLLATLRENEFSPGLANMAQALVFSTIHIPGLMASFTRPGSSVPVSVVATTVATTVAITGWSLWGLLFGWLRLRTGSIVPSFALHGSYMFVAFLATWAPVVSIIHALDGMCK
jgi:membrane protease YdiL (CAAX protease family)